MERKSRRKQRTVYMGEGVDGQSEGGKGPEATIEEVKCVR